MMPVRTLRALMAAGAVCGAGHLSAQEGPELATLLPAVRRAAELVPGDLPVSVHVVALNPFRMRMASLVEGGSDESVPVAYPVFQVRFPSGWIMVDAALDRDFVPGSSTFSDQQYAAIHEALRDARLTVVTHEHHDHVAGVLRSPHLARIRQHTLLTRPQVQSLLARPNDPRIQLDSATAARYVVLDYDPYLPIAPGVVLIKAAGHTPGSQMVYVRLASGQEVLLVGDVAWHTSGITTHQHKPEASTRSFGGEDRGALAQQLSWLRDLLASPVAVVVSHDQAVIAQLVERGVLKEGFDLRNK